MSPVRVQDKAHQTGICASLTHKAVISQMLQPHRKVSLGIIANLRGIKMFLTDWPLHLFPEVTLVTIYRQAFFGKCRLNVDMTFPTVVTMACTVGRLSYRRN